jgi:Fe-Mn family superoxide dismutase
MAATLFRTSAMRSAVRAAPSMRASIGGTTFVRGKATLPDLACMSYSYACN